MPIDASLKNYHKAFTVAMNNMTKDAPELEKVFTENLKKMRIDMATSLLSLSLGMGVPEADKSLPLESWASVIRQDPSELARAARDAQKLTNRILAMGIDYPQLAGGAS